MMVDKVINLSRYIIIDWGSSNFRLFLMGDDHQVLFFSEVPLGILQVKNKEFTKALASQLDKNISDYKSLPIILAGMVGSKSGWHDVPYVNSPASLKDVAKGAFSFVLPWGAPAIILPGVSNVSKNLHCDVMRGEEVQLFGLIELSNKTELNAVLPGTHSKHIHFHTGKICAFSTFMTGEIFALLSRRSSLTPFLNKSLKFQQDSFLDGVKKGQEGKLLHDLFSTRSLRIFEQLNDSDMMDYLSGVLIGSELSACNSKDVYLVGSDELCRRYQLAADLSGIVTKIYSGNACFVAGIKALIEEIEFE
jgi:2-dehydro-3-deoxygalactonokinase